MCAGAGVRVWAAQVDALRSWLAERLHMALPWSIKVNTSPLTPAHGSGQSGGSRDGQQYVRYYRAAGRQLGWVWLCCALLQDVSTGLLATSRRQRSVLRYVRVYTCMSPQ